MLTPDYGHLGPFGWRYWPPPDPWPTTRVGDGDRRRSIEPLTLPTHKNSRRNRLECDGYPMVVGDSRFDEQVASGFPRPRLFFCFTYYVENRRTYIVLVVT